MEQPGRELSGRSPDARYDPHADTQSRFAAPGSGRSFMHGWLSHSAMTLSLALTSSSSKKGPCTTVALSTLSGRMPYKN